MKYVRAVVLIPQGGFMKVFVASVVLAVMVSCAVSMDLEDSLEQVPDRLETDLLAEDIVFTQTIVTVNEDGSYGAVRVEPITLAQQLAERTRGRAGFGAAEGSALGPDPGCHGDSNWLYDSANLVGNRICFSHPAYMCTDHDLTAFARTTLPPCGVSHWAGGIIGCYPNPGGGWTPLYRTPNSNSVASLWTGLSARTSASGVGFYNDYPGGPFQAFYGGVYVQYPNVQTSGRYVRTCGTPLN